MSVKTATITLDGDGTRLIGRSGSGHQLTLDDADGDAGMRPAELVPMALAGCTAMDVIAILRKKRQVVSGYVVEATGHQSDEQPHRFTRIDVSHIIDGVDIDVGAVRRAIELSATRYCSVGATLSSGITEVHHAYRVRSRPGEAEQTGEVIVLGPTGAVAVTTPSLVRSVA
jgi:putative redox protein